jgi:LysM repeat protein
MRVRALGNALAIALISIILMLGALSISLVEFVPESTPTATNMVPPSPLPVTVTSSLQPTTTPLLLESPVATIAFTPTIVPTSFNSCAIPLGWGQVVVQSFDTLDSVSVRYHTSKEQLRVGNCLLSDSLVSGTILYIPFVPTNTAITLICSQGLSGWVKNYIVRSGDTFYSIATNYLTNTTAIKNVNCRTNDTIYAGEVLWVPIGSTRTPYPTLAGYTVIPYPTDLQTETALPFTGTPAPTSTPVAPTSTPAPTDTFVPTLTASPTVFP